MFPVHYEQYLTAIRIAQLGAGLALLPEATQPQVANALRLVLNEQRFKAAARAYAKRYPAYSPAEQQRRIVKRIEDILPAPVDAGETHA
jgi:UDP:flavonoid glycosyltransferase YjiC (YdhE family)